MSEINLVSCFNKDTPCLPLTSLGKVFILQKHVLFATFIGAGNFHSLSAPYILFSATIWKTKWFPIVREQQSNVNINEK